MHLLFSSLILLTHCIAAVVSQIFLLFPYLRHLFTSYRHPFLRPSVAYCSSFFTATSPFCSPALLQPVLLPPFTHMYRTWQGALNSHSRRNWWHVLGAGSSHRLQGKALPSWRWRISFNENERHKDYLGRKKETTPSFVVPLLSRRERSQEVCPTASTQIFVMSQTWVLALAVQD